MTSNHAAWRACHWGLTTSTTIIVAMDASKDVMMNVLKKSSLLYESLGLQTVRPALGVLFVKLLQETWKISKECSSKTSVWES